MSAFRHLLPLVLTVLLAGAAATAAEQRPNILFAIADDWGWPHAGAYGDPLVATPTFDRLAREGVLFRHGFVAAPTCTASRGAILTGQMPHRLEEGANLWSRLPAKFAVYPDLLEQAGYAVGHARKAWGPGTLEGSGRTRNPGGPTFRSLPEFLKNVPPEQPFCFWFGSPDPHRPYGPGTGAQAGIDPKLVRVPPFLPDTPTVRSDVADYYFEVQRFDRELGEALALLEQQGRLANTLVVVTGDNGMPFPKAKATLYDAGTHVPLVACWPGRAPGGRIVDDFVSLTDLAPTFLEAAGLKPLPEMTGRSLLPILTSEKSGQVDPRRDRVFTERERHAYVRPEGKSYPCRAMRTRTHLYIRNLRPQLGPAGVEGYANEVGDYGDVDGSPTKSELLARRQEPEIAPYFQAAFGQRPAEELFDMEKDPGQMHNLAADPAHTETLRELRAALDEWMAQTADPRAQGETDFWDTCIYAGNTRPPAQRRSPPK